MTQGRLASTEYLAADGDQIIKVAIRIRTQDSNGDGLICVWIFNEWIAYRRWQSDNRETK